MKRLVVRGAVAALVVLVALQLVPYGWEKSNPPVIAEPAWPDARSEALARDACYDCHSNETSWPVYSYVAPMSWLVRSDVESGRDELNFSEWEGDADDAAEAILDGEMPPAQYELMHPSARLSDEERDALVTALEAMEDD